MILEIQRKINVETLQAFLGDICEWFYDREIEFGGQQFTVFEELRAAYPQIFKLYNNEWTIMLNIDIETGEVTNWPKNCPFDFTNIKIVDTGTYVIHTEFGILDYQGYVPDCLGEGGYGDYLMFEIDENSHIVDWKFDQEVFDQFVSNIDVSEYEE
jgi:hypothetical protein